MYGSLRLECVILDVLFSALGHIGDNIGILVKR